MNPNENREGTTINYRVSRFRANYGAAISSARHFLIRRAVILSRGSPGPRYDLRSQETADPRRRNSRSRTGSRLAHAGSAVPLFGELDFDGRSERQREKANGPRPATSVRRSDRNKNGILIRRGDRPTRPDLTRLVRFLFRQQCPSFARKP